VADLREVFEMVKQQTEPDTDSWSEQERRLRRSGRNRKIGAFALVAALAVGTIVFVVNAGSGEGARTPATEPAPVAPEPVVGFAMYDLDTGALTGTGIVAGSSAVDVSPDGTKMAYGDDAVIHVADVDGSNDQAFDRTDRAGAAIAPRWSPDGTKLVYQGKSPTGEDIGNLYVLDVTTGRIERITDLEPMNVGVWWMAPTFSADGQTVYFTKASRKSGSDGPGLRWDIWSVTATGGEPTLVHRNAFAVDVSPTGDEIAYTEVLNIDGEFTLGDLFVARPDGSDAHKVADGPAGFSRWSPDGSKLAYDGGDDGIYVMDVESGFSQNDLDAAGWPEWADDDTLMIEVGGV
jgi:WD40 repeat protein